MARWSGWKHLRDAGLVLWAISTALLVVSVIQLVDTRQTLWDRLETKKQIITAQDELNVVLAAEVERLKEQVKGQKAHIRILAAIDPLQDLLSPQDITYLTEELTPASPFDSPVRVTSRFGESEGFNGLWRRTHMGLDMYPVGNPIVGTLWAGKSVEIGIDEVYGKFVVMEHAPRVRSKYTHLETIYYEAEPGGWRDAGAPIGVMGASGLADGAHLHLELLIFDGEVWRQVDPYPWLIKED